MAAATEVKIFPSQKKVAKKVAHEIKNLILSSPKKRFDIALSGGTTPKKLFKTLVKKHHDALPWERIHFWWGDERCVPPDSDDSNFKMTNESLFVKVPVPAKNIHRIKGENIPDEEAERYAEELKKQLKLREDVPVFDLVILGLGEDGHTASIFPGQLELFQTAKICTVTAHPQTGQKRITLTGKVLNNAKNVYFLVTGKNKASRISEIMNNEEAAQKHPASYVEPKHGALVWFLDEPAASEIG